MTFIKKLLHLPFEYIVLHNVTLVSLDVLSTLSFLALDDGSNKFSNLGLLLAFRNPTK